ncbi:MAG: tRNA (adenosine(37)-N6)-threonylcarbamoyltransferase complex dimerization subunit type 1 TsaB [Pyrinomonadaceae bacterium]
MNNKSQIILALESAINGGSISLLRDRTEIAHWIGPSNVSKAEDLLANIDTLLSENGVSRHEIDLLAVSAGPGSFTGIRIGIVTALGLKAGLSIDMASNSVLKAMVATQTTSGNFMPAVPVGRNAICIQSFEKSGPFVIPLDQPRTVTEDEFAKMLKVSTSAEYILHGSLYDTFQAGGEHINFGTNLAVAIGRLCSQNPDTVTKPLFISKSF